MKARYTIANLLTIAAVGSAAGQIIVSPVGDILHEGRVNEQPTNETVTYIATNPTIFPTSFNLVWDPTAVPNTPMRINNSLTPDFPAFLQPGQSLAFNVSFVAPSAPTQGTHVLQFVSPSSNSISSHTFVFGEVTIPPALDFTSFEATTTGGFLFSIAATVQSSLPFETSVAATSTAPQVSAAQSPLILPPGDDATFLLEVTVPPTQTVGRYSHEVEFYDDATLIGTRMLEYDYGRYPSQDTPVALQDLGTVGSQIQLPYTYCLIDPNNPGPAADQIAVELQLAHTSVQDLEAPLELEKDGSGNLVYDPDNNLPRTAQSDPLRTEDGYALCGDFGIYNACDPEAETLTVRGIDAEFRLSPFKNMNITPYVDMNEFRHINDDQASFISELNSDGSVAEYNFNIVDEDPRGIHYGIDIEFRASQNLRLSVRPELRQMDSNYIPTYFDSYYSLERSVYDPEGTGSVSQTKLEYLQSLEAGGTQVQGYFLEARLEYLPSEFVIDLEYTDYEGEDNSTVFLGLYFPDIILGISINGYYEKKNFNDYEEAFEYDQRSLAAAQVYKTFGLFKVGVNYVRTWEFNEDSGEYEPMDTKGLFFTFDTSF